MTGRKTPSYLLNLLFVLRAVQLGESSKEGFFFLLSFVFSLFLSHRLSQLSGQNQQLECIALRDLSNMHGVQYVIYLVIMCMEIYDVAACFFFWEQFCQNLRRVSAAE